MLKTPRRLLAAAALMTAIGCGDDGGSGPSGTITVSASPTALTVQQGGSGTVTVTLVRGGGFDEAVNVSVSGLPNGVTASVNPTQLTGNTTTATVTVNVGATVPAGVYTATVTASATGVGSATAQYTLTVTAAPQQNFTLSANPATVNITAGGTGTSTIQITRTDFTGAIALSLVNPPTGIGGTFEPASPTANQSTLTLSVAGTVAPGNHTVTVQGVGGGLQRTTTVTVTVAAGPSVTLAMNPTTLSIQQGQSGTSTLTATRSNFNGNITPSVTGNPAGMTVTFNPSPLTGNTSEVTVNVGAGVAPGNYTLTISGGTGGTAGTPTTTLAVTVTQAPAGGNLTWDFCTADGAPLKFWRLSGGTWSEVTPTVVGNVTRFSFTVADGQAGVAFTSSSAGLAARQTLNVGSKSGFRAVAKATRFKALEAQMRMRGVNNIAQQQGQFFDTFVWFAMSNELAGFAETGCSDESTTASQDFTVSNTGAGEEGLLGYGGATTSVTAANTAYSLNATPGSHDWMALWGPNPSFPDLTHNWNAYRIGRDEATGGAPVAIDRTGAAALVPFAVTVTGGAGGSFYNFIQTLEGSRGGVVSFPIGSLLNSSGTVNMLFPQPGDRLPTDLWSLLISNTELQGDIINSRIQTRYVGSAPPANGTFALVASVPAFTTSQVNGAPVPTWVATGTIPADYQQPTSVVSAAFTGSNLGALFSVAATRAWLQANNMGTNYTLTSPTLPGFLQAWAPAAPLDNATVIMLGTNLTAAPTAGTVVNIGSRTQ